MNEIKSALETIIMFFEEYAKTMKESLNHDITNDMKELWLDEIQGLRETLDEFEKVLKKN